MVTLYFVNYLSKFNAIKSGFVSLKGVQLIGIACNLSDDC